MSSAKDSATPKTDIYDRLITCASNAGIRLHPHIATVLITPVLIIILPFFMLIAFIAGIFGANIQEDEA